MPTDEWFNVTAAFAQLVGLETAGCLSGLSWNGRSVFEPPDPAGEPRVWLANIGRVTSDLEVLRAAAVDYVAHAGRELRSGGSAVKPLLALPLIGTAAGGSAELRGEVLDILLPELCEAARLHDVDVVLVTRHRRSYSAAQWHRRRGQEDVDDWEADAFDMGDTARDQILSDEAADLASRAQSKQLVLFLGAGVSAGAGLPTWQALLEDLARRLPDIDEAFLDRLRQRDFRDQAAVLAGRFRRLGRAVWEKELRETLSSDRHGLTHELLASLPTTEAATTNYDRLFESAVDATGESLAVLPRQPAQGKDRWLLKLHGDIEEADSMVLTRDDYLQAPMHSGALFGLVQAMLMTRHMLFVGYSLSDEDFHQLVHEVRSARRPNEAEAESVDESRSEPFGTVLTLFDDPLFHDLWGHDLRVVAMAEEPDDPTRPTADELGIAERRMQVFLDLLGMLAFDAHTHVLDPTFEGVLDAEDRELAAKLRDLADSAPSNPGRAWRKVLEFLTELGYDSR